MKCSGIDVSSGDYVEVSFDRVINGIDHPIVAPDGDTWLAPAWIDLQVNGYAAVDYNSPHTPPDAIARSIDVLHSTGTARFLPTVITGAAEDMVGSLGNLARAKEALGEKGEAIEGFHVEGPHISPEDGPRGAHPQRHVRPPDLDEYRRWQDATQGQIRLVTLSPEWPDAPRYVETLVSEGVVVSIGHTRANATQIKAAVDAGATKSTHIGNGAHSVLPRHPNYIWDQLAEDRLTAGFIVDGIHLGENFFKAALRAKGITRALLVTDASMPACAAPGIYKLGEQELELTPDNRVVLRGQTRLAGSALRMDDAIANTVRFAGVTLAEAISMANRTPARVGRIAGRQRGLATGERADLVQFKWDPAAFKLTVLKVWCGGRQVYAA